MGDEMRAHVETADLDGIDGAEPSGPAPQQTESGPKDQMDAAVLRRALAVLKQQGK